MKGKKKKEIAKDAGTLYLRDVPADLKNALIERGKQNKRSMSAEAIVILCEDCGVKVA